MNTHIARMLATLVVVATLAACSDRNAAQRQGLLSDIQQTTAAYVAQNQLVIERRATLAELERSVALHQGELADLQRGMNAYVGDHKLAVAAIVAGVAGSAVAVDPNNEFTSDQKTSAGVVALIAAAYALSNADEVTAVADRLLQADHAIKALRRQIDESATSREACARQLASDEGDLQTIESKRQQYRVALGALG